jgi:hypothetical protein
MAGYPVHRPANPWHGHRLLRRANIQPSATTGHSVHNAESARLTLVLAEYVAVRRLFSYGLLGLLYLDPPQMLSGYRLAASDRRDRDGGVKRRRRGCRVPVWARAETMALRGRSSLGDNVWLGGHAGSLGSAGSAGRSPLPAAGQPPRRWCGVRLSSSRPIPVKAAAPESCGRCSSARLGS